MFAKKDSLSAVGADGTMVDMIERGRWYRRGQE
jgi:hypothetical protein